MRQRAFLAAYSVCLLGLLGHLSLWVDEILQLMGTRTGTFSQIHSAIATGVGGVPLGWLAQIASIRLFGYSVESARLPSAIFSVGCCFLINHIAGQLRLQNGTLAICLFALLPLQFHYALEARPYTQGIFFSLFSTIIYLYLVQRPRLGTACGYALAVTLALYSQPLSFLIPLGHLVCSIRLGQRSRMALVYTGLSLLVAVMLFIPWYLYAEPIWRSAISGAPQTFHLPLKTPLLILREISGAGYLGSIALLGFAAIGVSKKWNSLWSRVAICCVCCCLFGGLAIDLWFGYFLAVRQFIFTLPFLSLLAAEGMGELPSRNVRWVAIVVLLLFVGYDCRWMSKPREDWQMAAVAADNQADEQTCIAASTGDSLELLSFFVPRLNGKRCPATIGHFQYFIHVESPYAPRLPKLSQFRLLKQNSVGQVCISVYAF